MPLKLQHDKSKCGSTSLDELGATGAEYFAAGSLGKLWVVETNLGEATSSEGLDVIRVEGHWRTSHSRQGCSLRGFRHVD